MTYRDETLSAFIDGELPEGDADALRIDMAKDPALKERVDQLRRANDAVKLAYSGIENEPLPDAVLDLFNKASADIAPFPGGLGEEEAPKVHAGVLQRFASTQWPTALAASLALVVGFGVGQIGGEPQRPGGALQVAGVVAEGSPVFNILETGASAQTHLAGANGGVNVEPVLSMQRADGVFCREYFISDETSRFHNVACKEDSQWEIKFAVNIPATNGVDDAYVAASVDSNALAAAYIDRVIAGDALDAQAEQAAMEEGWRTQ